MKNYCLAFCTNQFKAIHTYSSIKRLMEKLNMIHARMSHPCNLMSPIILTKWLVSACGLLQISNEIWGKKKRYLVSMHNPSISKTVNGVVWLYNNVWAETVNRVDCTAMYEQVQCGFKPQVTLELISNNNLFSFCLQKKLKEIC